MPQPVAGEGNGAISGSAGNSASWVFGELLLPPPKGPFLGRSPDLWSGFFTSKSLCLHVLVVRKKPSERL